MPLPLPINGVESIGGAKSDSWGQGPSHWVSKMWGLPFLLDEQVEAEVGGPRRLNGLGTAETPEDSISGIRTSHKMLKPHRAQTPPSNRSR